MKKIELTLWLGGLLSVLILGQACQKGQQPTPATQSSGPAPATSQQPQNAASSAAQTPPSSSASQPAPIAQSNDQSGNPFQVRTTKIPVGAVIKVRNNLTLTTSSNQTGDDFDTTLDEPFTVDGVVIAPKDATAEGKVVLSDKGGDGHAPTMVLTLRQITLNSGDQVNLQTSNITVRPVPGGVTGGSGTAGASGIMPSTRNDEAEINSQSLLEFRIAAPITVTTALK